MKAQRGLSTHKHTQAEVHTHEQPQPPHYQIRDKSCWSFSQPQTHKKHQNCLIVFHSSVYNNIYDNSETYSGIVKNEGAFKELLTKALMPLLLQVSQLQSAGNSSGGAGGGLCVCVYSQHYTGRSQLS